MAGSDRNDPQKVLPAGATVADPNLTPASVGTVSASSQEVSSSPSTASSTSLIRAAQQAFLAQRIHRPRWVVAEKGAASFVYPKTAQSLLEKAYTDCIIQQSLTHGRAVALSTPTGGQSAKGWRAYLLVTLQSLESSGQQACSTESHLPVVCSVPFSKEGDMLVTSEAGISYDTVITLSKLRIRGRGCLVDMVHLKEIDYSRCELRPLARFGPSPCLPKAVVLALAQRALTPLRLSVASEDQKAVWMWSTGVTGLKPFDSASGEIIELAYQVFDEARKLSFGSANAVLSDRVIAALSVAEVQIGPDSYEVNFMTMAQRNTRTGRVRAVSRDTSGTQQYLPSAADKSASPQIAGPRQSSGVPRRQGAACLPTIIPAMSAPETTMWLWDNGVSRELIPCSKRESRCLENAYALHLESAASGNINPHVPQIFLSLLAKQGKSLVDFNAMALYVKRTRTVHKLVRVGPRIPNLPGLPTRAPSLGIRSSMLAALPEMYGWKEVLVESEEALQQGAKSASAWKVGGPSLSCEGEVNRRKLTKTDVRGNWVWHSAESGDSEVLDVSTAQVLDTAYARLGNWITDGDGVAPFQLALYTGRSANKTITVGFPGVVGLRGGRFGLFFRQDWYQGLPQKRHPVATTNLGRCTESAKESSAAAGPVQWMWKVEGSDAAVPATPFHKQISEELEAKHAAYVAMGPASATRHRKCTIDTRSWSFTVDFKAMAFRDANTGLSIQVSRVVPPPTQQHAASAAAAEAEVGSLEADVAALKTAAEVNLLFLSKWLDYLNSFLKLGVTAPSRFVCKDSHGIVYEIDVKERTVINQATREVIYRYGGPTLGPSSPSTRIAASNKRGTLPSSGASAGGPAQSFAWSWLTGSGDTRKHRFPPELENAVEQAYQSFRVGGGGAAPARITLFVNGKECVVDLATMTQTRVSTGQVRRIVRDTIDPSNPPMSSGGTGGAGGGDGPSGTAVGGGNPVAASLGVSSGYSAAAVEAARNLVEYGGLQSFELPPCSGLQEASFFDAGRTVPLRWDGRLVSTVSQSRTQTLITRSCSSNATGMGGSWNWADTLSPVQVVAPAAHYRTPSAASALADGVYGRWHVPRLNPGRDLFMTAWRPHVGVSLLRLVARK